MKLLTTVIASLLFCGAAANGQVVFSDEGEDGKEPSELALRFIACDPQFTLADYAGLYYEYLEDNDYTGPEDSLFEHTELVTADHRFAEVAEMIDAYCNEAFRVGLAMELFHMVYVGDGDVDEAGQFVGRLVQLLDMADGDNEINEEQYQAALTDIMGYFFRLLFPGMDLGFEGLFETGDYRDDTIYDYDETFVEGIREY